MTQLSALVCDIRLRFKLYCGHPFSSPHAGHSRRLAGLSVLSADTNVTAEISEQLTGTNGLIKTGAGVVTLSGTNTATLSGEVFVNEGTLRWGDFYGLPFTTVDKPITVEDGRYLGFYVYYNASRSFTADIILNGGRVFAGGQAPGDTLGDDVVLVIPDDSDTATGITLTNGVYEMVHRVILGDTSYGPGSGSFGSTSSTADNQDDEYFSGEGIVYLPESQGSLIILR